MTRRGEPGVFRENLRRLNALKGLLPTKAAAEISKSQKVQIDPKWYRRLCREGLGQVHKRTRRKLEAVARFFGVTNVNNLWDDRLVVFNLSKQAVPPTEAEYTVKLVELLETGHHDYLRHLISTLHAMEFSQEGQLENGDGDADYDYEYNGDDEDDEMMAEIPDEFIRRRR